MSKKQETYAADSQLAAEQAEAAQVAARHKKVLDGKGPILIRVEDKKAWLRPLDRKTVSAATSIAGEDPVGVAEVILENCWLEGDEAIKTEDHYFLQTLGPAPPLANSTRSMTSAALAEALQTACNRLRCGQNKKLRAGNTWRTS